MGSTLDAFNAGKNPAKAPANIIKPTETMAILKSTSGFLKKSLSTPTCLINSTTPMPNSKPK